MSINKSCVVAVIFLFCATFSRGVQAEGWVSPTSHNDSDKKWAFENRAYDGSESLYAEDRSDKIGMGSKLELFFDAPILCSRLNVLSDWDITYVSRAHIEVRLAGTTTWENVFSGTVKNVAWTEIAFPQKTIDGVRWAYEYTQSGIYFWLLELRAYEDALQVDSPVAKTEAASSVEGVHANLVGSILDDGGQPCDYRFQWGLTANYSNATPWILASDGKGVTSGDRFTAALTGLTTGAAYHFRSSVRNTNGVSVGEDRVFVTNPATSPWISPTSFEDASGLWEDVAFAYDGNTSTAARYYHKIGSPLWSDPLILSRPVEICDRVRFFAKDDLNIDAVRIESRSSVSGSWVMVYEGPFAGQQWVEKSLPNGASAVQALRVTFKISKKNFGQFWEMAEVQLHSVTNRWTNLSGGFQWKQAGNWSLGHVPVAGESVVFDTSTQATCQALPNSIAQNLHSITVASSYTGRIIVSPEAFEGFSQILTVANDVTVNGGEMVLASKIINTISSVGVTINASNFTIGAGAVVHADEGGYAAQDGPAGADTFSFGGSHSGRGEDNVSGITYGDPAAPITSGSGGSRSTSAAYDPGGQRGGGAIKINVGTGIVRVDGQLRANSGDDGFHNSAAGGGIFLLCGTFEGGTSGLIQTRGGNISNAGRSPGGGGRIAVNFSGTSTFAGAYDVSGGSDPQTHGQPGTLWLPAGSDLTIKAPYKIGLASGSHSFGTVVVESGAELFCHSSFVDDSTSTGCFVSANSITVEAGGVISADEAGFAPAGVSIASGPGGSTSGASHGGRGAGGLVAYGDPLNPVTLGSGGNKASWPGSNTKSPRWGGGALKLTVTGALVLDGTISSNGGYHGGGNNGGSGGSVHVVCDTLSGSGSILANGGGGSTGNAGGGRIALDYNSSSYTGSASAAGSGNGEAGSVIPGSLSLAAHATGQTSDSFPAAGNIAAAQLLRFSLSPAGNTDNVAFENIEVSKLVFDLSHVSGIVSGDIANILIYADTNGDGLTTDETGPIATTGAVASIAGDTGTLTVDFAASVLVLDGTATTTNYIIIADVSNLIVGDALKISLPSAGGNVQSTGVESSKTISESSNGYAHLSGNISSAIHQIASGDITQYQIASGITQTQGNGWSATVTARDVSSNLVDALVEVTLTSSGSAVFYTDSTYSVSTTTATLEHGTATIFVKDDIAETIVLTATDAAANSGNSSPILVNPTPVVSYKFETTTTQSAGTPWQITLTAVDGINGAGARVNTEVATTLASTGNATFYSDAAATQQISSIVLASGQAILYVKDEQAEVMRLQVSDQAGKSGESADITVTATAIASYAVTGTSPRIKSQGFTETVTALDAFGNTVTTATNTVTLSNTGTALFFEANNYLTPTTTYPLVGGVASIFIKSETLETIILTATDSNGSTGDSPSITISLSIQQRIDLATAGDTIIIAPGEYHESFVVNKPLTITTANPSFPNKPIIDGDGVTYVCEIAASDVIIEGLEFRDSSSHLIFSQGEFEAGGIPHANTYNRVTIRHCVMHDGGGDGVVLRNIVDGSVENCLAWDVNGNGIFMDGVGNAVVKHNEVKGVGNMVRGILINWCYPATVDDNYIHDLYGAESALYFTSNWNGDHSIRNNVIANNNLRDMVSWHPFGGSALAIRKPTQDGSSATVSVEHNTIVGNSGNGPGGITGHAIAWDLNGASNLTVDITNNLMSRNSGKSFAIRQDSVDFGNIAGGLFDFNDMTEEILLHSDTYLVGSNNIGAPPVFTADLDAYGKYVFRLGDCLARNAADDGRDMGALLNDPTGPLEENVRLEIAIGASDGQADDILDEGAFLDASVKAVGLNPWGSFPSTVRVYLTSDSAGSGLVEIWSPSAAGQITYVDVSLSASGEGSASFKIKGITASSSDNDVSILGSLNQGNGAGDVTEDLTVLVPGSYNLITTTFRVEDGSGVLVVDDAFVEVEGLGMVSQIVPSNTSISIRDGSSISYRTLIAFGDRQIGGDAQVGIVSAANTTFVGTVGSVVLRARDQNAADVAGAFVKLLDSKGRNSGFYPVGTNLIIPVPGAYQALGRVFLVESDGTGVPITNVNISTSEVVADFRTILFKSIDQNSVQYTDVEYTVSRGGSIGSGSNGFGATLPVGGVFELSASRYELSGSTNEFQVGATDTEAVVAYRAMNITVKDQVSQNEVASAAWRLLVKGFEKTFGSAGLAGNFLVLPVGAIADVEGFLWNASARESLVVDNSLGNIDLFIDLSVVNPVTITSNNWSEFSSAFIEGTRDPSADDVSIEVVGGTQTTANLLGNDRWYGYLPLADGTSLTIRATASNKYGQNFSIEQSEVSWTVQEVGGSSDSIIPINAALLLGSDASGVTGAASIDIVPGDGQAAVNIGLGAHASVTYPTSGSFTIRANILDAGGVVLETRTLGVTVVQVTTFADKAAAGLNYTRPVWWEVEPKIARAEAYISSVDDLLLQVTNQRYDPDTQTYPNRVLVDIKAYEPSGPRGSGVGGGQATFVDLSNSQKLDLLTTNIPAIAFRIGGETGWIPETTDNNVEEFTLFTDDKSVIVEFLQLDGSYLGTINITMLPRIEDLNLTLSMIGGSDVSFKNGSSTLGFSSNEMDFSGEYGATFSKNYSGSSFCHSVQVQQNPIIFKTDLQNTKAKLTLGGGIFAITEANDESTNRQDIQEWIAKHRYFAFSGSANIPSVKWYMKVKNGTPCSPQLDNLGIDIGSSLGPIFEASLLAASPGTEDGSCVTSSDEASRCLANGTYEPALFFFGNNSCSITWPPTVNFVAANPVCYPLENECYYKGRRSNPINSLGTGYKFGAYDVDVFLCDDKNGDKPKNEDLGGKNFFQIIRVEADGFVSDGTLRPGFPDRSTRDAMPVACVNIVTNDAGTSTSTGTPFQVSIRGPESVGPVKVRVYSRTPEKALISTEPTGIKADDESWNDDVFLQCVEFTLTPRAGVCFDDKELFLHGISPSVTLNDVEIIVQVQETHAICVNGSLKDSKTWVVSDREFLTVAKIGIAYSLSMQQSEAVENPSGTFSLNFEPEGVRPNAQGFQWGHRAHTPNVNNPRFPYITPTESSTGVSGYHWYGHGDVSDDKWSAPNGGEVDNSLRWIGNTQSSCSYELFCDVTFNTGNVCRAKIINGKYFYVSVEDSGLTTGPALLNIASIQIVANATGTFEVTGRGNLARRDAQITSEPFESSQFYNKTHTHEAVHRDEWNVTRANGRFELYDPDDFYEAIQGFSGPSIINVRNQIVSYFNDTYLPAQQTRAVQLNGNTRARETRAYHAEYTVEPVRVRERSDTWINAEYPDN